MKYLTLPLIVFLLSISSCHLFDSASKPELPPITMTGKNTFGCMINGKLWLPKGQYNVPSVGGYYYTLQDFIALVAANQSSGFRINIRSPILIGYRYDLTDTSKIKVDHGATSPPYCYYLDHQISKGSLMLSRWDIKNSVISGVFEFDAFNKDCSSDTLRVTDGRFDISDIAF